MLDTILQPEVYPELYGNIDHVVRINYYPPRGDNKEGWDNIDIFGWMGYPMQIKVDFLCRDSILAAPIVLDLALFIDLAARAGQSGVQEWLSFYFKAPQAARPVPRRARHLHPADQAEEHAARVDGRGARHPLRGRLNQASDRFAVASCATGEAAGTLEGLAGADGSHPVADLVGQRIGQRHPPLLVAREAIGAQAELRTLPRASASSSGGGEGLPWFAQPVGQPEGRAPRRRRRRGR